MVYTVCQRYFLNISADDKADTIDIVVIGALRVNLVHTGQYSIYKSKGTLCTLIGPIIFMTWLV